MNIYSRIEPTKILHIIVRKRDVQPGRTDIVEPQEFIQCAALRLPKDTTFKAHKHLERTRSELYRPQESWAVITGLVEVILYDIDDSLLHTDMLEPGDISITICAGHTYKILAENTLVYEYKTGPYRGQETDKVFINE